MLKKFVTKHVFLHRIVIYGATINRFMKQEKTIIGQ